jgi:hypothetical protein
MWMDHLGFCFALAAFVVLLAVMETGAGAERESVSITLGAASEEQGLALLGDVADGASDPAEMSGRACRRVGVMRDGARSAYLYLRVDRAFMHDGVFDCYVRVEYFDAGEEAWNLQYDSSDDAVRVVPDRPGAFKGTEWVLNGDTQAWRSVDFHLPDARFANRCNGGDLRVNAGPAGALCVARVTVFATQPADYRPAEGAGLPMGAVSAGPGVEVTFGATNFAPGEPAERIADHYRAIHAEWVRGLGATSWESYVRWSAVEPEANQWDFGVYDAEVERLKAHGLKWVPFLILGPAYATPEWYRASEAHLPYRCLEHGTESAVQSLWNADLPSRVDAFM